MIDRLDNNLSLLDKLFQEFSSEKYNTAQLHNIWNAAIEKRYSTAIYNDIHIFKEHVASVTLYDVRSSLIAFYEVMAILKNCEIKYGKISSHYQEMATYFAGIIYRAQNDPSSRWYNLLKYSYAGEMIRQILVRGLGTGLIAGISTAMLTTHGLAALIFLSLVAPVGGISGAMSAITNSFSHATTFKTPEYKSALNGLNNLEFTLDKQSIEKFQSFTECCRNEDIHKLKKLTAISTQLTKHLENKTFILHEQTETSISADIGLNYKPEHDQKHVNELINIENVDSRIEKALEIIQYIDSEVGDKSTANEAVLRIIAILSAGINNQTERLHIILIFIVLFKEHTLKMSRIISEDRSFYTQRHYLIPEITFSTLNAAANIARIPIFNIPAIYQTLAGITGNMVGTSLMIASSNNDAYRNTSSFQTDMDFLKDVIFDLMQVIENKSNDEDKKYKIDYKDLCNQAKTIFDEHYGRYWFQQFGKTEHNRKMQKHEEFKNIISV